MSETGLFRIKPPPITMPPPPPTPAIPAFDYVVDIYSDKVVVTNPDGTTTQLASIAELNSWLGNITGKRIRINVNVELYSDIYLSPNEYWIFGEWIHGNVYLTGKNITIVSFTRLGDESYRAYVTNYDPETQAYTDVSGLKLYSIYAELYIYRGGDINHRDVLIYVEHTSTSYVEYIVGDMYMRGRGIVIVRSTLHNAYVEADWLILEDVTSSGNMGVWVMIARCVAEIRGTVDARNTFYAMLYLYDTRLISVGAQSSVTVDLPTINYDFIHYRVVFIGVMKGSNPYYYDSLPSGVTWYFDDVNRRLVITNNTSNSYDIVLAYEI